MSARELVVLGTASQVPTRDRSHHAALLRWDDEAVLFDPGEGTQRQLTLAGIAASSITRICLTHLHGDHCLGLPGVVQRMTLDGVRCQRTGWSTTTADGEVSLEDVSVPRPGQVMAFVMDTRRCAAAVRLAERADLLVCEATFLSDEHDLAAAYGRLTATQAAQIARDAGARRLVLTHFSQRHRDVGDLPARGGDGVRRRPRGARPRPRTRAASPSASHACPGVSPAAQPSRSATASNSLAAALGGFGPHHTARMRRSRVTRLRGGT